MNEELKNRKYELGNRNEELGNSVVDNESSVVEDENSVVEPVETTKVSKQTRHSERGNRHSERSEESPVKMVKLSDICEQISGEWGKDCDGNTGTKVLKTTNFTNIGIINYKNVVQRLIPENKIQSKQLRKGDIILEKSGGSDTQPVGRVVFFERDDETFLCNNFTVALRITDSSISSKYVFDYLFYLYSIGITKFYQNQTTGIHNLKTKEYLDREIPLPPLETQKQIAARLDLCADTIAKHKKLLELHETLVKSQFVKMFGDNPIDNGQWKIDNLGNLCTVTSSKRIYAEEQTFSGIPFLRVSDLVSRINGIITNDLFIPNETFYELKRLKLVPQKDDILVTSRGTLGLCYVIKSNDNFYFQDGMITWLLFENHDKIISTFLDYLFRIVIKPEIDRESNGSTIKYISISNIKTLKIPVPPLALQQKFASFVLQVEKSKSAVQKSLEKAEVLYKALMQKYFG